MINTVIVQTWEESERGWGTRPDGCSLHMSQSDREMFIKEYWAKMPKEILDEYSRPSGEPYEAEVDDVTLEKIKKSKNGIWEVFNVPPRKT